MPAPVQRYGYLLAKITKKKYAEALLDGQVYMRALRDFNADVLNGEHVYIADACNAQGPLPQTDTGERILGDGKDGVQLDPCEGMLGFVDPSELSPDFQQLMAEMPDDVRKKAHSPFYSETGILPYLHLYCMYGLRVDTHNGLIMPPDARLKDFGDTAVLIIDPAEFISRVTRALDAQFDSKVSITHGFAEYLPDNDFRIRDEFCKRNAFSWQNEFRLSAGHLTVPFRTLTPNKNPADYLVRDEKAWTLEIGSIRDIATPISTDELIDLNFSDVPGGLTTLKTASRIPKYILSPMGLELFPEWIPNS